MTSPFVSERHRLRDLLLGSSIPEPNSGCFLWPLRLTEDGYPLYSTPLMSTQLVHRQIVELTTGFLPKWLTVDHRCFVRCCINPDHLVVTSRSKNSGRHRR